MRGGVRRLGAPCRLASLGESRGKGVIPKTIERLSLAARPASRDSYCDVYFPSDRGPAVSIAFR
jgi:hypothetical protein